MKGFQGALQEVECRRKEECVCGGHRGRCMLGIDRHLSEPVGRGRLQVFKDIEVLLNYL